MLRASSGAHVSHGPKNATSTSAACASHSLGWVRPSQPQTGAKTGGQASGRGRQTPPSSLARQACGVGSMSQDSLGAHARPVPVPQRGRSEQAAKTRAQSAGASNRFSQSLPVHSHPLTVTQLVPSHATPNAMSHAPTPAASIGLQSGSHAMSMHAAPGAAQIPHDSLQHSYPIGQSSRPQRSRSQRSAQQVPALGSGMQPGGGGAHSHIPASSRDPASHAPSLAHGPGAPPSWSPTCTW